MIDIVKQLFSQWNERGVIYCHWKGNNHIQDAIIGKSDFDILISDNSLQEGCKLLRKSGYMLCHTQYGARFPGIQDWIGVDSNTGTMIHVHLHKKMIAGHSGVMEYILPWNEIAFSTRVFNEEYGLYVLNPSLEIILLYTRLGIEHSSKKLKKVRKGWVLKESTQVEIKFLKERCEEKVCSEMAMSLFPSCYNQILEFIHKNDLSTSDIKSLSKIVKKGCSRWLRYSRLTVIAYRLYKPIEDKFRSVYYREIHHCSKRKTPASGKGLTVAFLGQDGAGKTTVTKNLIKWWHWKMDVKYVYLGSGDNYTSWKKKLSRKIPSTGVFKLFRFLLTLTDIRDVTKKAYRNILSAEKYASKGGLVVYDRYPQLDYPGICDGPKIRVRLQEKLGQGLLSKLLMYLADSEEKNIKRIVAHHPDVVIKLILPPEESIRRKPQEKLEAVKQKHEIVKSLEFKGSDVYTIDATMPFDEELIMIKNIIWQHIQK